jgi:hypothetical protein
MKADVFRKFLISTRDLKKDPRVIQTAETIRCLITQLIATSFFSRRLVAQASEDPNARENPQCITGRLTSRLYVSSVECALLQLLQKLVDLLEEALPTDDAGTSGDTFQRTL